MRLPIRAVTVALATAALTLSAPAATAAPSNAGHDKVAKVQVHKHKAAKGSKGVKGAALLPGQRQLLRRIEVLSAALGRVMAPARLTRLSETSRAVVQANAALDRAALEDVRLTVELASDLGDLQQVRQDLKAVRAVNYVLVVNVVRQAEERLAAGVGDQVALAAVVDEALTVTASSSKADIEALRTALEVASAGITGEEPAPPVG